MGWFTGALTGLKAILGTPKAVTSIAETVQSGVAIWDKSKFTDQEKGELNIEGVKLFLRIQEATANENSLKSITRRWLACSIVGTYLLSFFIGLICLIFSPKAATQVKEMVVAWQLDYLALGVCSFYFIYYGASQFINKKK